MRSTSPQVFLLTRLEVLGEALTMGEKSGVGQENVHKLVKDLLPAPP
jgi:3-hydroxyisobutyrate dehydrogenase-like beta-hydroxyacid dehydrogenase